MLRYEADKVIITNELPDDNGGVRVWEKEYTLQEYSPLVDVWGSEITTKSRSTLAAVLAELYVTYRGMFNSSYFKIDKIGKDNDPILARKGGVPIKLTQHHLEYHLCRYYAVHIFAGKTSSKFVCFDVDHSSWNTVAGLINAIEEWGIPRHLIYPSTSGNKGYHVDVFFDRPVSTGALETFYKQVLKIAGMSKSLVEFRPTHTQSIKLPLSVHPKTGCICWFLDRETGDPYDYADYLLEIEQMPREDFVALMEIHRVKEREEFSNKVDADEKRVVPYRFYDVQFDSLPAWAPMLTESGTRHETMVKIALDCRKRQISRDSCRALLDLWIKAQDTRFYKTKDRAVAKDADSICDWAYQKGMDIAAQIRKTADYVSMRNRKLLPQDVDPSFDEVTPEVIEMQERLQVYKITAQEVAMAWSLRSDAARRMYLMVCAEASAKDLEGHGFCHVSMKNFADRLHLSERSIVKGLQNLEELNAIQVARYPARKNDDGSFFQPSHTIVPRLIEIKHDDWREHVKAESYVGRLDAMRYDFRHEYLKIMTELFDAEYVSKHLSARDRKLIAGADEEEDAKQAAKRPARKGMAG